MSVVVDFGQATFYGKRAHSECEQRDEKETYGMLDTYVFNEWQDCLKGATLKVTELP